MDLKKLDTSRFLFNPTDSDLVLKLSKYVEFKVSLKSSLSKKQVLQYIILMYDKNNDEVRAEYPFYPQRKIEVARAVGLVKQHKAPKVVEDLMVGGNDLVNKMIIRYLSLFNNPDLLMLAAYYEIFIKLNQQSFSGDFDTNTIKNIKNVNESIKELTESIFGGKDETGLRQELYKSIEEQSLGIKPEEIAEAMQSGKDPLDKFSAYDEGYIPDELKYLSDR